MDQLRLRAAEPDEAAAITELARRSKAYWGYSREFLDRVRDELTVHAHQIRAGTVVVAADGATLLGYYRLDGAPPDGELADLFVEPGAIGTGLGRRLWDDAVAQARQRGFRSLELEADPNAEAFYRHVGARKTGERQVASGRTLPVLRIDV
ncbi:GNAT family N-acetyltransferase [Amycolatopsis sp. NPDC051903]|uniref:GNAT family N-acetyltransferase n=1 Tax=Amycolatopsis sp. NPDC051903 TaxID=3363936 RepID=UPI003798F00F